MKPSSPAPPAPFTAHAFGKIPSEGDFVRLGPQTAESQNLAQRILDGSQAQYSALQTPDGWMWEFFRRPSSLQERIQLGLIHSSRDSVGRHIPIAIWLEWDPNRVLARPPAAQFPYCFGALRERIQNITEHCLQHGWPASSLRAALDDLAEQPPAPVAWPWPAGNETWPIDCDELWVELFAQMDRDLAADTIFRAWQQLEAAQQDLAGAVPYPMASDISQYFWTQLCQPERAYPSISTFWRTSPPQCVMELGPTHVGTMQTLFRCIANGDLYDADRGDKDAFAPRPDLRTHPKWTQIRERLDAANQDISALIGALHADFAS